LPKAGAAAAPKAGADVDPKVAPPLPNDPDPNTGVEPVPPKPAEVVEAPKVGNDGGASDLGTEDPKLNMP